MTVNPYCAALEALRAAPTHKLKEVGDQWRSPDRLWWGINSKYGPFVLDLFADRDNAKCEAFYSAEDNALTQDWSARLVELHGAAFANPPYSRACQHEGHYITGMRHIMAHTLAMREAGGRYVFLIKAATGEIWWPEEADHVAFIRGRISFDLPVWYRPAEGQPSESSAGFGAAIAVFDKAWRGPKFDYVSRDELEARGAAFMRQIELAAARLIPSAPCVVEKKTIVAVSFSGGRTSAYLVHCMEQRRLAGEDVRYLFMDTGAEHPETYKFIRNVVKHWKIDLICLRVVVNPVLGQANSYRQISIDEIGPDLQPWRDVCSKYGTPYVHGAFCTRTMKLEPFERYCKDQFEDFETWLGIRADEPLRLKPREDIHYLAEVCDFDKQDVIDWWKKQPFDLVIPEHLGNCVFCVKKGINKIALAARDEPQMAADFIEVITSDSVRVVERRQQESKIMYRGNNSLETVIGIYSDHSREDIAATIRGGGGYDTGSCSESCEVFVAEDVLPPAPDTENDVWPAEVKLLAEQVEDLPELPAPHHRKVMQHINRMLLEKTPPAAIIQAAKTLKNLLQVTS